MNIQKEVDSILQKYNILHPPIDIRKILESEGIKILEEPMTDDISGVLDRRSSDQTSILINSDHGEHRKSFTLAHEFGHYKLHDKDGLHVDKRRFYRDSKSKDGVIKEEIQANRFAAELLMPKSMITKAISDSKIIDLQDDIFLNDMAKKFKVSKLAMALRLKNLFPDEFDLAF